MKYKIVPKKMPAAPEKPEKYYASIVRPDNISLEKLAKRIAEISPVNELDTKAVLLTFTQVMPEFLEEGATVELGEFGRMMVNINSYGAEKPENFSKEMIKRCKIVFRPGIRIKEIMKNVSYVKE